MEIEKEEMENTWEEEEEEEGFGSIVLMRVKPSLATLKRPSASYHYHYDSDWSKCRRGRLFFIIFNF